MTVEDLRVLPEAHVAHDPSSATCSQLQAESRCGASRERRHQARACAAARPLHPAGPARGRAAAVGPNLLGYALKAFGIGGVRSMRCDAGAASPSPSGDAECERQRAATLFAAPAHSDCAFARSPRRASRRRLYHQERLTSAGATVARNSPARKKNCEIMVATTEILLKGGMRLSCLVGCGAFSVTGGHRPRKS